MKLKHLAPVLALSLVWVATAAMAEDEPMGDAQANNPLADFVAVNVQNYYIPELSGLDNQNANIFWLRYAQPFGKWLMRASLPVNRVPTGPGETTSGLGDLNTNFFYLIDTGNRHLVKLACPQEESK